MFRKGFALDYIREPDSESVGDDALGVPQTGACEAQNKVEVRRKSRQICSILIGNNVIFTALQRDAEGVVPYRYLTFSDKPEVTHPPNSEIRNPNLRSIVPKSEFAKHCSEFASHRSEFASHRSEIAKHQPSRWSVTSITAKPTRRA